MKRLRCANCGAEADHEDEAIHMVECPDPAMFTPKPATNKPQDEEER